MLDHNALRFSPSRDGVPSSDDNFYASDLIAAQDALEAEARDAIPFASTECTYDLGYLKQPLFACLTCLHNKAVCAGCSVSCHGEHQLVELFNRRNFRCDCGTSAMGAGSCCSITGRQDAPPNERNRYDKQFHGHFCFCGQPYDPHTETDTMYQCITCEDWVHHACLFGKHIDDDEDGPMQQDDFDLFVCERCVKGNKEVRRIVERYAGVEGTGIMLVTPDKKVLGKAVLAPEGADEEPAGEAQDEGEGLTEHASTAVDAGAAGETGEAKRKAADEAAAPQSKRAKADDHKPSAASTSLTASTSSSSIATVTSSTLAASQSASSAATSVSSTPSSPSKTCTAPPVPPPGESPLAKLEKEGAKLNVYLEEGWMTRWCRCSQCLPMFVHYPYLLDEEDVYEPPEDPDADKTTFELGMNHLMTNMPRAQALDSIQAFTGLSDRLKEYLRPHAGGGTVTKELIDAFFEQERERREALQRG
ncbi:hypothetical protein JCM10213_006818 [Rhodosporidiobolus nylandii]